MYAGLSQAAYECLRAHGSPEQRATYLPKLASGEWTGTMCMTESQCGTDLGLLRTRAALQADGTYRLTGSKIFISAGEHDMSANIVHLVLARLPDAPAGSKGVSLFVVPKILVGPDGSLAERNDVHCAGLEHKMGIHGNATCQIVLEDAVGTLVGLPNKGLQAMFVMMNSARLAVGMQSLGLTEVAYQNAAAYAKDRLQMRSLSGPKARDREADPIIVHPDVRRMLLTARAYAEGARALALHTAVLLDVEMCHPDPDARAEAADEVALLTPVVKAFISDNAWIATSLCQQVLGGHGYIREWGMEQYVRDSRINMIYEGTNSIQALDLLGRKVLGDGGRRLRSFCKRVSDLVENERHHGPMREFVRPLADLNTKLLVLTEELTDKVAAGRDELGAAAVDYLRIVGHLAFAYFWARMARAALDAVSTGDEFYVRKLATARFYFAKLLPETTALIHSLRAGSPSLLALDDALF